MTLTLISDFLVLAVFVCSALLTALSTSIRKDGLVTLSTSLCQGA